MLDVTGSATIEKNIDILPLTKLFLKKYEESVGFYQTRSLTEIFIDMEINRQSLPLWRILHKAGLSEERMTIETKTFLSHLFYLLG